ncbi:sugar ABC transporter ATP-binding protein [Horticoccus sp. 23ND18S-11]|uniref:sugar ABC transporter ATP-binding protein n=1 Tax=Horticoccus sp. 23ND18S-11 TaxID=3391832 RepID=UPI0039C971DE
MSHALLDLRGITKRFLGVTALSGVDFSVRSGEIHALLGENGAGKSTLIKVLTGVHRPDGGTMTLDGGVIAPASPKEAELAGISTVYQEVNLIPALSVAENIALGRQPGRFGFVNWAAMRRHARAALAKLEIACDVDAELGSLSVALQQMVAIARALDLRARLLVLDEPTASLDEKEVGELFKVMRQLRADGLGIVFVTHFLDQVYAVSDRLTVLRNGQRVGDYVTAELPRLALISRMLGREVTDESGRSAVRVAESLEQANPSPPASADPHVATTLSDPLGISPAPVLEARGLTRRGAIAPIDLTLRRGEATGLAGLLGSGRTETARLLFGLDRADGGTIAIHGRSVRIASPREAVQLGLAFCSEDRKTEGILPNLSVRENLIIALQAKQGAWRTLSRADQSALCAHYIAGLRIKTADAETPIKHLSGGNQQKVLLARWLGTRPELIILDEPTRGIDVGAKAEVEQLIAKLCADGLSVLLISSEIEEIVRTCGRVTVLRERRSAGEVAAGPDLTPERLMRVMAGTHE